MTTYELKQLFRSYADEPDTSFLTDSDIELYLGIGYGRFRALVNSVDEMRYAKEKDVSLTASKTIDLAASGVDFETILSVSIVNTGDTSTTPLVPVTTPDELFRVDMGRQISRYLLIDGSLKFSSEISATVRVVYVPKSTVVWSTVSPGATVDSMTMFHDLIVLLAYANYAIRDGEQNMALMQQMQERLSEFRAYLMEGQSRQQSSAVIDDPDWL